MNTLKIGLVTILMITSISCTNQETKNGKNEWRSLFNGKDLNGWVAKFHHHELGDNYANTFRVDNGTIQVNYEDYTTFDERYGHLFYEEPFSSYHLKFEYKFTDQWQTDAPSYTFRNSGIMFHAQDPKTILKEQDWPISVEYQMLAEEVEGESRPTGNMCSPGTDVVFNDEIDPRHCISSSSETYPWQEWIQGELIVYGDSLIIHKVNGEKVLAYTKPQIGGGVANRYDPEHKIDGTPLTSGYIGLQAEGQGIAFKNILIKELD